MIESVMTTDQEGKMLDLLVLYWCPTEGETENVSDCELMIPAPGWDCDDDPVVE